MESSTTATTTMPVERPATSEATPAQPEPVEAEPLDLCPVQESIKIVGRKWHLIILWELSKAELGFNDLKIATRGISAKMLSQSLSDLERYGLVLRDILSQRPLRVSYRLTDKARELAGVFQLLHAWGERHGLCATNDDVPDDA